MGRCCELRAAADCVTDGYLALHGFAPLGCYAEARQSVQRNPLVGVRQPMAKHAAASSCVANGPRVTSAYPSLKFSISSKVLATRVQ